jgi:hypothetical protein
MDSIVDKLVGRWVHVYEEDDATHRVFRREGTPLPPSRGRLHYEIDSNLTAHESGPGADDRMTNKKADLRVVYGNLRGPAGPSSELKVVDVDGDRLVLDRD